MIMPERENSIMSSFDNYTPKSQVMRDVYETVADFARHGLRCIFCGPRGVGKEILASYYVRKFREERSGGMNIPYVSLNCAVLTDSLAQSELFGHAKGAFTGADFEKEGLFAKAKGGVLFLDEIGDLSPVIQPSLNRALGEPYEAFKVGATNPYLTEDVTVISATEQPKEKIRKSLLDRLQHIITVPSLDERQEDIPAAVEYFVLQALDKRRDINDVMSLFYDDKKGSQSADAVKRIENVNLAQEIAANLVPLAKERSWPGNLRSLRTTVDAAVIRAKIGGGRERFHKDVVAFFLRHRQDCSMPKNSTTESVPVAYQTADTMDNDNGAERIKLGEDLHRIFPGMNDAEQAGLIDFLLNTKSRIFRRRDFEMVFPKLKRSIIHGRLRKLRDQRVILQQGARGELYRFPMETQAAAANLRPPKTFLPLPLDVCWPDGVRESLNAIRGLLEHSRAVFVGGQRGVGKTVCVQALGVELSVERAVFYYPFGDRGISMFLDILNREIQDRGIADRIVPDTSDPDQLKSYALLMAGYVDKLFPMEEKPLLILDNVQLVADPAQEKALSAIVKYWKGLSYILVGEKLSNEFQKDDQERILEYQIVDCH
jgi:DNA-binding NtrC family response regulator